jgi:hypothetical protein
MTRLRVQVDERAIAANARQLSPTATGTGQY